MKKMLITGASGFLAKNLIEFYQDKYEIKTVSRSDIKKQYHHMVRDETISSLTYKTLLEFKPDIIIHAAAEIYNNNQMFEANVELTQTILNYCSGFRKHYPIEKLILIGSSSEYGYKSSPMKETDSLEPRTLYEATKGMATLLAQGYSKTYGLPVTVVRPFTVVGRHEKPHKFFPTLLKTARENGTLKLSEGCHDFVFIDDFLAAFDKILQHKEEELFNIVNIGSGYGCRNNAIAELFELTLNHTYKKEYVDKLRSFDSDYWVADNTLLKEKYGYNKFTSLATGVHTFIQDCERLGLYV